MKMSFEYCITTGGRISVKVPKGSKKWGKLFHGAKGEIRFLNGNLVFITEDKLMKNKVSN
jgi:hypothetical protein